MIHIFPVQNGWALESLARGEDRKVFTTEAEALAAARQMARGANGEVVVHGRYGQVLAHLSFTKVGRR